MKNVPAALPPVSEESADVSMKEEQELCQAFSEALLDVLDVDKEDSDQPELCSEYVKDIYDYLHVLEVTGPVSALSGSSCVSITAGFVSTAAAGGAGQLHAGL